MPKVSASSGPPAPDDIGRHETAEREPGDVDAGTEQTFSQDQGTHLAALGARPTRSSAAGGSDAPPCASSTVRRRRLPGERRQSAAEASTSGSSEGREARDAGAPNGAGGFGQFARRAGWAAANGLMRAAHIYVGFAAVSSAYRAGRHPRDIFERPIGMLGAGWTFAERLNEQTVAQARADVIERHGGVIPPDSACYDVTPRIVDDLPLGTSGMVDRGDHRSGDWRPTDLRLKRFVPSAGGLHAAHHEYLHCFTHPAFASAISGSPHAQTIEEALTEHFADRLPGHAIGKLTPYDFSRLSNNKRWSTAAEELERKVGSDTLQRAYFSGDADAVRAVSAATVEIWPKDVTNTAWRSIRSSGGRKEQQRLAECFVGAALLATGRVPPEPRPGSGNYGNWAMDYLPVTTFTKITPPQAQALQMQAEALRARLGSAFDQAFYGFDEGIQGEAMASIRAEIDAAWKPVL